METPQQLIDINDLPRSQIERLPNGGIRIDALARNSDVAYDENIQRQYQNCDFPGNSVDGNRRCVN
ncbi:FAD binding domain-containing protein [Nostoc muscorum FACHB-395]|uniref:FAD binding domain-containing protein n=1 Tax=Nostoc punctiforme TaxID=272131 RepID=UPI0016882FAE|nr:FAD binding domain-containing protein [Desmonostoc muscorum FACHB-395]